MAIVSKDLLTVRQYENSAGIKVHVEIDRVQGRASLVEPDGDGGYKPKDWLFAGRDPRYLRTWVVIMQLMQHATKEAIKDIEAYKKAAKK